MSTEAYPSIDEIIRRRAVLEEQEQQRREAKRLAKQAAERDRLARRKAERMAQPPATSRATRTGARHPLTQQHREHIAEGMKRRRALHDRDGASALRLARLDRGLTVAEAAALANVSPTTFSAMETTPTLVGRISRGKIRRAFPEVEL